MGRKKGLFSELPFPHRVFQGRLHYEKTKPSDAFQELRQAANGAYDQIEDIDLFAWRVREGELP
jgi:hypothetical protein